MKFWEAIKLVEDYTVPPNTVHVVPHDDLIRHTMADDCLCGPSAEHLANDDGDGWLFVHHSLDGRELDEMKYRKKPVVIDAYRITDENIPDLANKCGGQWIEQGQRDDMVRYLVIHTLEGDHRGDVGDWLIRGVAGEWYPCKHDIFRETYEPATDSTPDIPEA